MAKAPALRQRAADRVRRPGLHKRRGREPAAERERDRATARNPRRSREAIKIRREFYQPLSCDVAIPRAGNLNNGETYDNKSKKTESFAWFPRNIGYRSDPATRQCLQGSEG